MIAAAIVCAAACSQAGQFCWGIATYENEPPTAAFDDGSGYFDGRGTAVLSVLGAEGWTEIASAEMDGDTYYYGSLDPNSPATDAYVNALTSGSDTANLQQWKIVLTTEDGAYYTTWEGTAENFTVTGTGSDTYIQWMSSDVAHTASDWVAAPEPTSGLLLLLGVAGLALRRRRA